MNKTIAFSIVLIVFIAFFGVKFFTNKPAVSPDITAQDQPQAPLTSKGQSQLNANSESNNDNNFSEDTQIIPIPSVHNLAPSSGATLNGNIWSSPTSNTTQKVTPKEYAHFDNDGVDRAYIEIARLEIENLQVGGNFNLNIPQTGSEFDVKVTESFYHPNGDKTIRGTIESYGDTYAATITQGKEATFGTFSTPDGVYILEANMTSGWLASKNNLIRIQDRSKTDEVHLIHDDSDLPTKK